MLRAYLSAAVEAYTDSTLSEFRMSFFLLRMKSRNAVFAMSFRPGDHAMTNSIVPKIKGTELQKTAWNQDHTFSRLD
jgi:hypothetical protein